MRCPNCGSPVMIRGNRWECGWCGNYGTLRPRCSLAGLWVRRWRR